MNILINGHRLWMILFICFIASFSFTFLAKKIALHVGALDMPNRRKIHLVPMPRLGGLSIFAAYLLGYMIYGTVSTQMISVLIGGFVILLTGVIDDIKPIRARYKFFFQLVAAVIVVVYGGLYFNRLTVLGLNLQFPIWGNMLLSIFFMVAIINAINLTDGLDGLAAGISSIYYLTIAILGIILNKLGGLDIILSLIMLGSTLGFLVHNFPPARIFMGDTGSMFLGFMISVIALLGYKVAVFQSVIVPLIVLFVPIFDTVIAMIRRLLKHESIATPDKEHFHHQFLKMTSSPTKAVLSIYLVNISFSAIAIIYSLYDEYFALILYGIVMIFFVLLLFKTNILFDHDKIKGYKKTKKTR